MHSWIRGRGCTRGGNSSEKKRKVKHKNGIFGKETNADVYIMGICHAEFGQRGITREFVLFDETMIWKQILIHTG